jgi:hypothetical protein
MTKTTKTTTKTTPKSFYADRARKIARARATNQRFGLSVRAQRADARLNRELAGL